MIKLNWIFTILSFLAMNVVEGEAGAAAEPETPSAGGEDQQNEDQTPEDAVLDAIGLGDGDDEVDGQPDNAGQATAPDDAKPEDADAAAAAEAESKKAEQDAAGKEELTDADLAPLDSKNPKTNERFQKVTEGYKQEKQRADTLQAEVSRYQQSFESLRALGYSDEGAAHDLVNFSEYRKAIYSGDEKTFSKIISEQIKQFESLYGKKISIQASALDDHPDLKEKVTALELDEGTALEVARSRDIQARIARESQHRTQQQQIHNTNVQVLNETVSQVEQMQAHWQKNDPDYPAILPHLQPMMEEIGRNYAPNLWPQLLDLQYKSLKKALAETQASNRGNALPLRGHGNQGARPAPATTQDAVLQELGLDGE